MNDVTSHPSIPPSAIKIDACLFTAVTRKMLYSGRDSRDGGPYLE